MHVIQNTCCGVAKAIVTLKTNLKGYLCFWSCGFVAGDGHQNLYFSVCYSKDLLLCSEGSLDHEIDNFLTTKPQAQIERDPSRTAKCLYHEKVKSGRESFCFGL